MTDLEYFKLSKPARMGRKLLSFFRNLPKDLLNKVKGFFMFFVHMFVGLFNEIKDIVLTYKNGDWKTRVSFTVMGFGSFSRA